MTKMTKLSCMLRALLLCAFAATPLLTGCEEPPDNSPAVSIISPVAGQKLPAGQAVSVMFSVSGIDAKDGTMVPFKLEGGETLKVGRGQVRAYFDSNNFHAKTIAIPNTDNPFLVPDAMYGNPADLVKPGMRRIRLLLFYNDGTVVEPQRQGEVVVEIQ